MSIRIEHRVSPFFYGPLQIATGYREGQREVKEKEGMLEYQDRASMYGQIGSGIGQGFQNFANQAFVVPRQQQYALDRIAAGGEVQRQGQQNAYDLGATGASTDYLNSSAPQGMTPQQFREQRVGEQQQRNISNQAQAEYQTTLEHENALMDASAASQLTAPGPRLLTQLNKKRQSSQGAIEMLPDEQRAVAEADFQAKRAAIYKQYGPPTREENRAKYDSIVASTPEGGSLPIWNPTSGEMVPNAFERGGRAYAVDAKNGVLREVDWADINAPKFDPAVVAKQHGIDPANMFYNNQGGYAFPTEIDGQKYTFESEPDGKVTLKPVKQEQGDTFSFGGKTYPYSPLISDAQKTMLRDSEDMQEFGRKFTAYLDAMSPGAGAAPPPGDHPFKGSSFVRPDADKGVRAALDAMGAKSPLTINPMAMIAQYPGGAAEMVSNMDAAGRREFFEAVKAAFPDKNFPVEIRQALMLIAQEER